MASTHSSQVSFESSHNLNSSIDRKRNYVLTQKYDPVLTRRRLQIEEWMDEELREIYECDEDEDYDIEIDIDQLLECPADERCTYVKNILVEAKKPID
uniref:Protein phosphatase 1 regulatory subunit 14B-like n=1 Tax=Saccoglossus kowalevskii TaxID=10224 RepID=A0ABM0M1J3_SACKO